MTKTTKLTVAAIAGYLNIGKCAVQRRAKIEKWPHETVAGACGTSYEYVLEQLPEKVRAVINEALNGGGEAATAL